LEPVAAELPLDRSRQSTRCSPWLDHGIGA
jgi:hypothetical protein